MIILAAWFASLQPPTRKAVLPLPPTDAPCYGRIMKHFLYLLTVAWESEAYHLQTRLLVVASGLATGWLMAPWLVG